MRIFVTYGLMAINDHFGHLWHLCPLIIKSQHYDEDGAPQRAGQSGTGKSLVCSCSGWNNKKSRSFMGYTGTVALYYVYLFVVWIWKYHLDHLDLDQLHWYRLTTQNPTL